MNVWKNTLLAGGLAIVTFALPAMAQASKSGTTTLSVGVVAESSLVVNGTGTTTLAQNTDVGMFGDFIGATTLTYKLRTSKTSGSGSITAQLVEFNGNGPKIETDLRYSSSSTLGNPVSAQAPIVGTATNVLTFTSNVRSANAGTGATVNWTLTDNPQYETDTYTSVVTFTISAS